MERVFFTWAIIGRFEELLGGGAFKILCFSGVFQNEIDVPAKIKTRSEGLQPKTEDTTILKLTYLCLE
jgi:hypothetical protein